MNPYLERHWGDVHASLVLYARNQLNQQLPGSLRARVEERLVVENPDTDETRSIKPDVKVYEPTREYGGGMGAAAPVMTIAEPDVIQLADDDPETTTYLKILDPSTGGTLITVIEFLSPSNKQPSGVKSADRYLAQRDELKLGGVSLVEIDLLRRGERFFPEYEVRYGKAHAATYAACVHRGWQSRKHEIYRFNLRDRLPAIRIPLRKTDPDAVLDLQALVDQVYLDGRYDDIDYTLSLDPPFAPSDADWVRATVTGAKS